MSADVEHLSRKVAKENKYFCKGQEKHATGKKKDNKFIAALVKMKILRAGHTIYLRNNL